MAWTDALTTDQIDRLLDVAVHYSGYANDAAGSVDGDFLDELVAIRKATDALAKEEEKCQ